MNTSSPSTSTAHPQQAATLCVNLDTQDAQQLARSLAQQPAQARPRIEVDCSTLKCLHTLGVSHVISQLLLLRQSSAGIWLRNANPTLKRCLRLLQLESRFFVAE